MQRAKPERAAQQAYEYGRLGDQSQLDPAAVRLLGAPETIWMWRYLAVPRRADPGPSANAPIPKHITRRRSATGDSPGTGVVSSATTV